MAEEQLPLPEVIRHLTREELERGLDVIRQAPRDTGVLKLIVRPERASREGGAVLEVTSVPHTGCQKFVSRFGLDAMKFVNSPLGRELNLRGINARVVQPGVVRVGAVVTKVPVEVTGGELARA
jgi:MOSC domain-containing protein YiiM